MYGKLINNQFYEAPKKLNGDGVIVYNPPSEMYLIQGWKPVIFTNEPEVPNGYTCESKWAENENEIIQIWELVELPDDIDESEAYNIIFGDIE